jgi:3-deoxy-D-manno-octulosonic-acid transferase
VLYLPADTPHNVQKFIDYVSPEMVFFVKYELWLGYLRELKSRQIKVLLIAASVSPDSAFFRSPFRKLYREAFAGFTAIFTQNALSAQLIQAFSQNPHVYISGDTRYDRVLSNAREFQPLPEIERFINGSPQSTHQRVIICGSAWPKEIAIMMQILPQLPDNYKIIIAPHEIHPKEIEQYMAQFPLLSIRFSEIQSLVPAHKILWIDNIGMLSRLYHYADVAFIGGGFQKALHNILEAAVYGCVVVFGSNYHPKKYPEGEALIAAGGAFVIDTASDLMRILNDIETQHLHTKIRTLNQGFVVQQSGATTQIVDFCQQMHWLS